MHIYILFSFNLTNYLYMNLFKFDVYFLLLFLFILTSCHCLLLGFNLVPWLSLVAHTMVIRTLPTLPWLLHTGSTQAAPSPSTAAQRRAHRRLTREDNRYHSGNFTH